METGNSILTGLLVLLFITASVSVCSANTLCVSPESGADNYTSIEAALEQAHDGDKILVYPGNYTENVVVSLADICIVSASGKPADTIIQARDVNESVFCVLANGIKISGFTIQGSERAGIELNSSDDHMLLSNVISENPTGILLNYSNGNTVYRNSIEGNVEGITVLDSDDSMVAENIIRTNEFAVILASSENNGFSKNILEDNPYGFIILESENIEVVGNTINSSMAAFMLDSSANDLFSRNKLTNTSVGFLLQQSRNNVFTGNLLDSTTLGFIQNSGKNSIFSQNILTNNTGYGFLLQRSENNEITGNTIDISEISLSIQSGRDNEVSGNSFSNGLIGTMLVGSNNSTISQNEFSNNLIGIIGVETDKSTLVNNDFSGDFSGNAPKKSLKSLANLANHHSNVSALLDENSLFKGNGLLKQNKIFKDNVFLGENSSLGQKYLFKENESLENQLSEDVELLNDSGLIELDESFNEDWNFGIILEEVNNSILERNRISDNYYGVVLLEAHNSKLCGNRVENNNFGLALNGSSGNLVYNNYLNNTNNVVFDIGELFGLEGTGNESNIICTWNLSKTKGTNIVGGPYKGGNYWALPNGTGFSQTQKDANKDGLSDLPYHVTEEGLNIDFLPLSDFQSDSG